MLPSSLRYTIESSWLIANKNSSLVSSWKFTILPFVDRVTYHVKSTRFVFTGKRKLPIFHGNGVMARPDSKKFVRGNLCSLRYLRRTKRGRWKILDASPIVFRPFSFFFFPLLAYHSDGLQKWSSRWQARAMFVPPTLPGSGRAVTREIIRRISRVSLCN